VRNEVRKANAGEPNLMIRPNFQVGIDQELRKQALSRRKTPEYFLSKGDIGKNPVSRP
jgi:hypothetical protein